MYNKLPLNKETNVWFDNAEAQASFGGPLLVKPMVESLIGYIALFVIAIRRAIIDYHKLLHVLSWRPTPIHRKYKG